ncbi:MAG: ATP synthase F1 subunit gamma [Oscillospiraceae bacterium]
MGTSMKMIKDRIKSVEGTMQITKAMELVSSSKLRKAKERAEKARPFFNILYETISELSSQMQEQDSIYTFSDSTKKPLYVVVAGDRGLAGGYNSNIFKLVDTEIKEKNAAVIAIGKKSAEHYERVPCELLKSYGNVAENLEMLIVSEISDIIIERFQERKIGSVYLIFTQFVTALTQTATKMQVLPLHLHLSKERDQPEGPPVLYEPSAEAVFNSIIPQYVAGMIFGGVVESYASEQGARRTSMESATNNARDMIDHLSLSYNRARQSAITQELTEIVAGANAAS